MSDEIQQLEAQLARVNARLARLQAKAKPLRNRLTVLYADRYTRENPPEPPVEKVKPGRNPGPRGPYKKRQAGRIKLMQDRWLRQH